MVIGFLPSGHAHATESGRSLRIGGSTTFRCRADTDAPNESEGDDDRVRLPRSGLAALACLGLTVAAEIASLVLSWGFADPLDTVLFALDDSP